MALTVIKMPLILIIIEVIRKTQCGIFPTMMNASIPLFFSYFSFLNPCDFRCAIYGNKTNDSYKRQQGVSRLFISAKFNHPVYIVLKTRNN